MARITTYENDESINGKDKLLGSDSRDSGATKNYLIADLADYVSANINKGYKSYVCLLNQSGTNPPVPTVLENSLAIPTVTNPWQRQQAGIYNLIAPGIVATFPVNKTIVFLNNGMSPTISNNIRWDRVSNSEIEIVVQTGDQYLEDASFEVRVYD